MTRAEEKYIKYFDDDFNYPCVLKALQSLENEMQQENELLKAQIEKMKCCENCYNQFDYYQCANCKNKSNWSLAE